MPVFSSRYVCSPLSDAAGQRMQSTDAAQKLQENCFEKCVPKPGTSLSSGETTCMTSCMEKYMSAWNQVNTAYIARIRQESGNQALSS